MFPTSNMLKLLKQFFSSNWFVGSASSIGIALIMISIIIVSIKYLGVGGYFLGAGLILLFVAWLSDEFL